VNEGHLIYIQPLTLSVCRQVMLEIENRQAYHRASFGERLASFWIWEVGFNKHLVSLLFMLKPTIPAVVFVCFENRIHRSSVLDAFVKSGSRYIIKGPHVTGKSGFVIAVSF
jgi:hypothetical protein